MHHFDAIAALTPSGFSAQQGFVSFKYKISNLTLENVKNGLWAMEQKRKEQNNYRERQRVARLNKHGFCYRSH